MNSLIFWVVGSVVFIIICQIVCAWEEFEYKKIIWPCIRILSIPANIFCAYQVILRLM